MLILEIAVRLTVMNEHPDLTTLDPLELIHPRRRIESISAILLPFQANGDGDWAGFTAHVRRTAQAGLIPAVNMDTGFVNLIDDATRRRALELTRAELGLSTFAPDVFASATPRGLRAIRHSMNSTTCCNTSAFSPSARPCPPTNTAPRCF